MIPTKRIDLVYLEEGEWMGVYIDGILVYQNHSVDETQLLDFVGIKYNTTTLNNSDGTYDGIGLPDSFSDIPENKKIRYDY